VVLSRSGGLTRASTRPPSVKHVAAVAGVSVGTVSNVLNRPDRVSTLTRVRVEQAMAELGFVRNESARQLRAGSSRTLAYVMLDATNPFFTDVARGVEDAADGSDLSVFLCNSDNSTAKEGSYLERLHQQRVQGILITPTDPDNPRLRELAAQGTPVIIVDRRSHSDALCSVAVDDALGGRLATDHLLELGHRHIAFVGGPLSIGQVRDRLSGAQQAVADAGLEPTMLTLIDTSAMTVGEGRGAGERLAGLPASTRPTAAVCANDLLALGLLQQCVSMRRRVPEDLAIVGYDDIEFAAAAAVPLTSVRQPRRRLGQTAAELLLDENQNPDHTHRLVKFDPELVVRASTGRS
jgi:LacI family transcriptional regulator